jgi:uracil-DNA glycosylase
MRDENCTRCRLSVELETSKVCRPGQGPSGASVAVVSRTPVGAARQQELYGYLSEAGIERDEVFLTAANRCSNWQIESNKADVKACRHWLFPELAQVNPKITIALGNEALLSLTGHSGIMKWRGK